ncbi:MAG: ABC transporter permease [Coriobacteriia bacterium]|nr:ABC transporter permease [Coriobacteriia bacterium]
MSGQGEPVVRSESVARRGEQSQVAAAQARSSPPKKYLSIFRIRFINALQYRAAALAGVSTQFAWGFMELFAFRAFYQANPAAFPMEFSQTVCYVWLQQAFLTLFMMWYWENDIITEITEGAIAYQMVRPVDIYNRWFCQSAANRLARALLRCIPLFMVVFFLPEPYRMSLPPSFGQFLLFVLSAALSLSVVVAFSSLVYVSLFYTLSPTGTRLMASGISDFLAGGLLPLPFFPAPIRAVVELLPFASMQNMPLRIYSGHIAGIDALSGIGLQVFWLLVLVLIGRLALNKALKRVIVQGG